MDKIYRELLECAERVRLTPLRDEDSDRLFAWINDRELVVSSAPFRPVARADHDAWFAAIRAARRRARSSASAWSTATS